MQQSNQRAATELHKAYVNKTIGFDEYHRRLLELEKNDMTDSRITHEGQHKPTPPAEFTVAADWRANGEKDPHGTQYDCERASLTLGELTDDQLANAVYLHGDTMPNIQDVVDGNAHMPIVYLTAAKDRIRWLSRKLEECQS